MNVLHIMPVMSLSLWQVLALYLGLVSLV